MITESSRELNSGRGTSNWTDNMIVYYDFYSYQYFPEGFIGRRHYCLEITEKKWCCQQAEDNLYLNHEYTDGWHSDGPHFWFTKRLKTDEDIRISIARLDKGKKYTSCPYCGKEIKGIHESKRNESQRLDNF
jgi:hypothetical protein